MEILCTPNTADVEDHIKETCNIGQRILHIVPTMILFIRRAHFYRRFLIGKGLNIPPLHGMKNHEIIQTLSVHNIHLFELNLFLDDIVYNNNNNHVLTKRESSVILKRIMDNNPTTANIAWDSLSSDIHEMFQKLTIADIPINDLYAFSSNDSWHAVVRLYQQYLQELTDSNLIDFGLACSKILEHNDFGEFEKVYIDGAFLPIQPALHKLICKLNKNKKDVSFFIPFDWDNPKNPAFRVLKKTYECYLPTSQWKCIQNSKKPHNVVQKLAKNIFSDKTIQIDDRSVEIVNYETLEDELESLVEKAAKLIKGGLANPRKIAIVTPNPMEIRPNVRELAEFHQIKFESSERPLIQLPFGKFIYLIYQIKIDRRIELFGVDDHYIDIEIFSDLINAKVLNYSEKVIPVFEKLKAFFEDSFTFTQWYQQLALLKEAQSEINKNYCHHPLYYLTQEQLLSLESCLKTIEQLSREVMQIKNMTFDAHLNRLIKIIQTHKALLKLDEETKNRLNTITKSLSNDQHIEINSQEFAQKIHSLFQDNQNQDQSKSTDQTKITVTGLNNVEYQKYDYIFLTRFTQSQYPEQIIYKWPMNLEIEYAILKHSTLFYGNHPNDLFKYYLDRSLYHLFIVINSTRKKLIISYANKYDGIDQSYAHYLHDIAKVFNIEVDVNSNERKLENLLSRYHLLLRPSSKLITHNEDTTSKVRLPKLKEGTVISIEETAIFEYCPRRFYYEKQFPEQKVYTNTFHIQLYATACLYEATLKVLVEQFPQITRNNKKSIYLSLEKILDEAKNTLHNLFPLSLRHWEEIKLRAKSYIEGLIENIFDIADKLNINSAFLSITEKKEYEQKIGPFRFKGKKQLRVRYPNQTNHYSTTNLKDLLSFSANLVDQTEQQRMETIKGKYHHLLTQFCSNDGSKKKEAVKQLKFYSDAANKQSFYKTTGGHCQYCTFREICMEKEIQVDEING